MTPFIHLSLTSNSAGGERTKGEKRREGNGRYWCLIRKEQHALVAKHTLFVFDEFQYRHFVVTLVI